MINSQPLTYLLTALFFCIFSAGCMQTIKPMSSYSYPAERVLLKNYTLNEKRSVVVGDQVIVHKDYYAFKRVTNKFAPTKDFSISAKELSLSGKKNEPLQVHGITEYDGKEYYLLPLNNRPDLVLLIDKDGSYIGKSSIVMPGTLKILPREISWVSVSPPDVKFPLALEEVVDKSAGFTNFELIYTGKNTQSLTFLYREYTPDDMIRAAYSQNLIYSIDSTTVKFRKIRLQIEKVTDDGIEYRVTEDK